MDAKVALLTENFGGLDQTVLVGFLDCILGGDV